MIGEDSDRWFREWVKEAGQPAHFADRWFVKFPPHNVFLERSSAYYMVQVMDNLRAVGKSLVFQMKYLEKSKLHNVKEDIYAVGTFHGVEERLIIGVIPDAEYLPINYITLPPAPVMASVVADMDISDINPLDLPPMGTLVDDDDDDDDDDYDEFDEGFDEDTSSDEKQEHDEKSEAGHLLDSYLSELSRLYNLEMSDRSIRRPSVELVELRDQLRALRPDQQADAAEIQRRIDILSQPRDPE